MKDAKIFAASHRDMADVGWMAKAPLLEDIARTCQDFLEQYVRCDQGWMRSSHTA